jgi:hypothetical protein
MNAHRRSPLNESGVQDDATAVPNDIDGERNRAATEHFLLFLRE